MSTDPNPAAEAASPQEPPGGEGTARMRLHARVDRDFTYHAPRPHQVATMQRLREAAGNLAHAIVELVPAGREQSTALTKIEEAVMHANAGIARHG